ncbi:hypothetical protein HanRHA438_Chr11g0511611 [Helianthus annuus]|uniref:DUF7746 domain-containing protein n=1 Tax=Helianthus annuus TaxID=4232 RepID=A0A9K3N0Q8_HELAN|nr:hypothetical protein HanXRQr2_Chr11g0498951 [Helianthus annuus]KAJ0502151.1 hypothetical protein HanHA300_Chr11g0409451 [Helianthus annuus]KAJ0510134.1 hypothetical protein HanIR_Chr11g0537211 [Helianthus annuus]KAJ0518072.1 hypothetical protein HanHA89_Chr11g0433111 [Helianthus annuus]KAJ0686098.1 hypothetical protein HanLR1_Chr11g0410711 [Helianthus annuus]
MMRGKEAIHFAAFKRALQNESILATIAHINHIIQQNNYTNLCLVNLSEIIHETNNKIERYIVNQKHESGESSKSTKQEPVILAKTTIQPPLEIEDYKIRPKDDFMEIIKEKFSNIQLNTIEEEIMDNETYEAYVIDSINKFEKGRKQKTYNTKYADRPRQRLYNYPRPTPQDVLHEEQEYEINNSYNEKAIYKWNLDGYTDRQVYMMTHRMMMYTTIAKNNNNTDQTVCKMIAAGFTGQLKGWWDNYIGDKQSHIYEHIKQEGDK